MKINKSTIAIAIGLLTLIGGITSFLIGMSKSIAVNNTKPSSAKVNMVVAKAIADKIGREEFDQYESKITDSLDNIRETQIIERDARKEQFRLIIDAINNIKKE